MENAKAANFARPGGTECGQVTPLPATPVTAGTTMVTCPGCGTTFRLPIEARGKRLRCGSCRRVCRITDQAIGRLANLSDATATPVTNSRSLPLNTNAGPSGVVGTSQ